MKIDLSGKVALVTGASRGIGFAAAQALSNAGANVALVSRSEKQILEAVKSLSKGTSQVIGFSCDVSELKSVQEVNNKILDKLGPVDILVNNAGVVRDNLLALMSEDEWDTVLKINLKGAFNCTKSVLRRMIKKRWGRIINISSISGVRGIAGQANYSASKAGLIGLTKTTALEVGSRNITVNAIAPGYIETAMTKTITDASREQLRKKIPLARLGKIEDISGLIVFLASDKASYITGQVLGVDGGLGI